MHARVDNIADAEFGTFDWLLEPENEEDEAKADVERSIDDENRAPDTVDESTTTDLALDDQSESESQGGLVAQIAVHGVATKKMWNKRETTSTIENQSNPIDPEPSHESDSEEELSIAYRREDEVERELRRQTRQSFLTWFKTGNQVYHISGKAGSGKSTLMKFLCRHSRLEDELKQWAGSKKLVFASFFFWNSGDHEQKTLGGLYRSLLFEILRQCPELIKEAFPACCGTGASLLTRPSWNACQSVFLS